MHRGGHCWFVVVPIIDEADPRPGKDAHMNRYPKIPLYMRRFFSTYFFDHQNHYTLDRLVEEWPMSGDRAWAEKCAAWLDGYLTANPSWDNAQKIVWQGWHDSGLLEDHKAYLQLIAALRIELARRLLNWRSKGVFNPFEKDEKEEADSVVPTDRHVADAPRDDDG